MVYDKIEEVIESLKGVGFKFIESYFNGEVGYWGFDKDRKIELTIKINRNPDLEDIKDFEEHIEETKEAHSE